MAEALSGTLASQIGAVDKVKEFFFTTNLLFSLVLIVFVVFFCIRAVSSTKLSGFFLGLSVTLFAIYCFFTENEAYKVFTNQLIPSFEGEIGLMLCALSIIFVFLGLRDEDMTQEYVHSRGYWWMVVISMYVGLMAISLALRTEQVLGFLGVST